MIIKNIPKNWAKAPRNDLRFAKFAKTSGYDVVMKGNFDIEKNPEYIPLDPLSFETKTKNIWKCIIGNEIVWRCADLVDNRYQNHRTYTRLIDALVKEAE